MSKNVIISSGVGQNNRPILSDFVSVVVTAGGGAIFFGVGLNGGLWGALFGGLVGLMVSHLARKYD